MRRAWPWWLGAATLAAIVAVLSSMPAKDLGESWMWRFDKVVHGSVYAALAGLIAGGNVARGWRKATAIAIAVALAVAYGASDEWHQSFTPGRDSSLGDLLADSIGATIGAFAVATLRYRRA